MKAKSDETGRSFDLRDLKRESIELQKRGLPFMMASVVLWAMITGIQMTALTTAQKNMGAFFCSVLLMPMAWLFAKFMKADLFAKKDNPINKLGFLCTMNQMLYILIVMWAYSECPDRMIMLYAMIFGAHLLPFGWLYDAREYIVFSVAETVLALVVGLLWGSSAVGILMIASQIVLSVCLWRRNRGRE